MDAVKFSDNTRNLFTPHPYEEVYCHTVVRVDAAVLECPMKRPRTKIVDDVLNLLYEVRLGRGRNLEVRRRALELSNQIVESHECEFGKRPAPVWRKKLKLVKPLKITHVKKAPVTPLRKLVMPPPPAQP